MRPLLGLVPAILLAACATTVDSAAAPAAAGNPDLEPLLEANTSPERIRVRVASSGCTDRRDFTAEAAPQAGGYTVTIKRVRSDNCGGFKPEGVWLTYSPSDLGVPAGATVSFANPVDRS